MNVPCSEQSVKQKKEGHAITGNPKPNYCKFDTQTCIKICPVPGKQ